MEKFILDTNIFFNMAPGVGLGKKTEEVVKKLTGLIPQLKGRAEFYMPPRIVDEFLSFFENKNQPFIKDFLSAVIIKSPTVATNNFPASVFYRLVDEIRQRSYRGLALGEEEIKKAGQLLTGKESLSKKDFEMTIGPVVKNFRERYRQATRVGFLDSLADLDLIVLAKELNGTLITTDEGIIVWARLFGVKEMPAEVWQRRLDSLLHQE